MNASTASEDQGVTQMAERAALAQKAYADAMAIGFEQARQAYEQAQQGYSQDLQTLYAELGERSQQAYKSYAEALAAAFSAAPSYEACMAECRSYLEHVQQLYTGTVALQQQKAAYEQYVQKLASGNESAEAATDWYRGELKTIWAQQPLRDALEAAQGRYLDLLQKLAGEAQQRQGEAWRTLLQVMGEIWSQPELDARAQGALKRLSAAARDVLVHCHATVEKSSGKAIEALGAEGT